MPRDRLLTLGQQVITAALIGTTATLLVANVAAGSDFLGWVRVRVPKHRHADSQLPLGVPDLANRCAAAACFTSP